MLVDPYSYAESLDLRVRMNTLKLKLKTNLYSAIKSEDSEALGGRASQLGSQRRFDEIEMF